MLKTVAAKTKDGAPAALLAAARYAAVFFTAMLLANSTVQGVMSPIPAALVGAVALSYGIPAFLGAMLTYFITSKITLSVVQIISMLIILVAKIFICEVLSKKVAARGKALITGACYLGSSLTVSFLTSQGAGGIVVSVLFSLLCFFVTYTGVLAFEHLTEKRRLDFSGEAGVCYGVIFAVIVAVLCSGQLFMFNAGRVLVAVAVLCAAGRYKASGGALCACAGILGLALCSTEYASASIFICIGGVAAGLLSGGGVLMPALVFFGINAAGALTLGASAVGAMADALAASALYILIPEKNIAKLFGARSVSHDNSYMASARFEFASDTIREVRKDVENISALLEKSVKCADLSVMVCDKVCADCSACASCWESSFDKSYAAFKETERKVILSGGVTENELPPSLLSCYRRYDIATEFTLSWRKLRMMCSSERKVKEMRGLLFEQFGVLEDILSDISEESRELREYDERLSREIKKCFLKNGAKSPKIFAYSLDGRVTVEGYFMGKLELSDDELSDILFDLTERDFMSPLYSHADNVTGLTIVESPELSLDFAYYQHAAQQMSGDSAKAFFDGRGNEYAVLSDGMGTGKAAAVDSRLVLSMLSRLVCAGVGLYPAARLINASMQVKSAYESFATLNIMRVNLHNGDTELIKFGNGVTFVKSGGKVASYETSSVPLGILCSTEPETVKIRLRAGDVAVIISDGIPETVYPEIKKYLMSSETESSDELARKISDAAKQSCEGEKSDDITAAVVKINKNSFMKMSNK